MMNAKSESKQQRKRIKRRLLCAAATIVVVPTSLLSAADLQLNPFANGSSGAGSTQLAPAQSNVRINRAVVAQPPVVMQPAVAQPVVAPPIVRQPEVRSKLTPKRLPTIKPHPVRIGESKADSNQGRPRPVRIAASNIPDTKASQQADTVAFRNGDSATSQKQPNRSDADHAQQSILDREQSAKGIFPQPITRLDNTPIAFNPRGRRPQVGPTGQPVSWLPSTTTTSRQSESMRSLKKAMQEYAIKAWASAEASAWECLQHTAEGIDIADRSASFGSNRGVSAAVDDLQIAKTAIREARDFAGKYGVVDAAAVKRLVLSHNTTVLHGQSLDNVPAADATDRYLNEARVRLSRLAKFRPEAAQALDLIAAIYLGRGEETLLPSETALCLRRAALQGQPGNASLSAQLGMQLAALGLDVEAKWALEHTMSIQPTPQAAEMLQVVQQRAGDRAAAVRMTAQLRSRMPAGFDQNRGPVPAVVQLSPREFARVSPAVNHSNSQQAPITPPQPTPVNTAPVDSKTQVAPVSHSSNGNPAASVQADLTNPAYYSSTIEKKSTVKRMIDSVKFWR